MKTFRFFVIISALAFATVSCVENSGKYKSAVAARDSLAQEKQALDSSYNQTLVLLNDIETGFAEINQTVLAGVGTGGLRLLFLERCIM